MTVTSSNNRIDHVGNGTTTVFPYDFLVYRSTDLKVLFDGVEQTLGFTITGLGNNSGGDVTFDTAPDTDVAVTLIREVPNTQEVDYTAFDPFPAETHERALDLGVMGTQQLAEQENRTLIIPVEETSIADLPT